MEARRPGFSLSHLAREKKKIDHHEKLSHFISKLLEDTLLESSVLPMRGIKKGRKGLGEIVCLPSPADQSQCFVFISPLSSSTTYLAIAHTKDMVSCPYWLSLDCHFGDDQKTHVLGCSACLCPLFSPFALVLLSGTLWSSGT